MPRLRINVRDLSDLDELDELDELKKLTEDQEPDREERREPNPIYLERRREGRKRGKEITKHLRQADKLKGR